MSRFFYFAFLVTFDVAAITFAYLLSIKARLFLNAYNEFPVFFIGNQNHTLYYLFAFIIVTFQVESGAYRKRQPFSEELKQLYRSLFVAFLVILALISVGKFSENVSRTVLFFSLFVLIILLPLSRLAARKILLKTDLAIEPVLILGAGEAGLATGRELIRSSVLGFKLIGFLDDKLTGEVNLLSGDEQKYPILGNLSQLQQTLKVNSIDNIIIAIPSMSAKESSALVATVQPFVRRVFIVPDLKGIALQNSELMHLFSEQLFLIRVQNNLKLWQNRLLKRSFDFILSTLLLPALIPVILFIAILIKLDSPGPVFFRQVRQGRSGKPFNVWKFRTMYVDAKQRLNEILEKDPEQKKEWEMYYKLKNDPRISRVGKLLRESSLDELPQVFNVFKGEMSLVGPRPVLASELDQYYGDYRLYYESVRPGISGLWQVSGRNDLDYDKRVNLDAWYVLNWSIWFDIVILWKTIFVVLRRKGAY